MMQVLKVNALPVTATDGYSGTVLTTVPTGTTEKALRAILRAEHAITRAKLRHITRRVNGTSVTRWLVEVVA